MKTDYLFTFCLALYLVFSCSEKKPASTSPANPVKQQLQKLSEALTEAEKNDDLKSFLAHYDDKAISMPEYQPTLTGIQEIEAFYQKMFQRQKIKTFQRQTDEILELGKTIIEIGTFTKEYTDLNNDTLRTQHGKYWYIWDAQPNGRIQLKGEAFGYFHPIEHPEVLTVQLPNIPATQSEAYLGEEIPFELKAYNALMEKGVRTRDGILRSEFFTNDARVMPFADSTVTGMANIKPYLIAYSSGGNVVIDSIKCHTYHYEYLGNYLLEYAKFKVKWRVPQFAGRTEGKGIRIWKRQADKSLKLFREIGTHNHME